MKVAIYARVSTIDQTTDNQLEAVQHVAIARGWVVVEIYRDVGISGAKGRDRRPALDQMLKDATRRRFNLIMAWSVDRLGRSLQHLVSFMAEIESLGIGLYLHQQALDTTTPSGRALFQMCGVFAEFEQAMISERVKAGLHRAKSNGVRLGRPPVAQNVEREILRRRKEGAGIKRIAKDLNIGLSIVRRVVKNVPRGGAALQ